MILGEQSHEALVEERFRRLVEIQRRPGNRNVDVLVDVAAAVQLAQIVGDNRHVWTAEDVVLANEIHGFPQPPADAKMKCLRLTHLERARGGFEVAEGGRHGTGGVEQGHALAGHLGAGAMPDEERDAELIFELSDLAGERRLRDVQAMGGAGEVPLFRDGDEGPKMPKVHEPILPSPGGWRDDAIAVATRTESVLPLEDARDA
jgi:hypothetical protein